MSTYTLLLDFGTGYEDYSSCLMADGFRLTECVGAEGKHQTQACSLQLRGEEITGKLYAATSFVKAILKKDSVFVFTGVIRPYISYTAEHIDIGKVSVEILDYSELLEKYVYVSNEYVDKGVMEAEYENYSIFNPSSPSTSIVHTLAGLCGINALSGNAVTKTISLFRLPGDSYVKDALEDLLYQHQLDYRFLSDGTMHILSTDISPTPAVTVTDFKNSFTHEKSDSSAEGCLVTYRVRKENVELANTSIAKFKSEKFSTGSILYVPIPDEVAPGLNGADIQITPEKALLDSNVIPPNCDLEWWDLTDIRVSSKKEDKGSFSTINTINSWDDEKVNLTVKWKGTIWLWQANYVVGEIYGTFDYIYKASTRAGITGDSPLSYDAEYIYSLSEAQTLADALARKLAVNRYTYTFSSFENLEVGALATLQEEDLLGLSAKVRILSRSYSDDTGLYSYTAEGAGDSTLNPPVPEIVPIEVIPVPQGDPLITTVSHEIIYSNDDLTFIGATATGYVPDFYGVTEFTWSVNDSVIAATSSTVDIPTSLLTANLNSVKCSAVYDGVTYEDIASVRVVSSERGISIVTDGLSYTYNGKGELSPADQLIHATVVRTGVEGTPSWTINGQAISSTADTIDVPASYLTGYQIIVGCTVGEYSASTYIYKISDGSTTIYQWCLSSSYSTLSAEDDKPRVFKASDFSDTSNPVTHYILWDDMPLSGGGMWQGTKPVPTSEKPYIWERSSDDNGETWSVPVCITPLPNTAIILNASRATYITDLSGYVLLAQQIKVSVAKINHNQPAYWKVRIGDTITKYSNVDFILIDIPVGFIEPSISVSCFCAAIEKNVTLYPEKVASRQAEKLSTVSITELHQIKTRDDGSPLTIGDYRLVTIVNSGETYHVPYRWNGVSWQSATSSDANYGFLTMGVLPDVLASDQTVPSISAIYSFFENLTSNNVFTKLLSADEGFIGNLTSNSAFIEALTVLSLFVNNPNFKCKIGVFNGEAVFNITYQNNSVFCIVPSSGKVFLGRPNSDNSAPETGFMYDPSSKSITTKNNRLTIYETGAISVTDGFFGGNIETASFSALPGASGDVRTEDLGSTAESQYSAIRSLAQELGLAPNVYYKVSLNVAGSVDSSVWYMYYNTLGAYTDDGGAYIFVDYHLQPKGTIAYNMNPYGFTYYSNFEGRQLILELDSSEGQVFTFKNLPRSSAGLSSGRVYQADDGTLKAVL